MFSEGPPPTARAARPPWRLAAGVAVFSGSLLFVVVVFALRAHEHVMTGWERVTGKLQDRSIEWRMRRKSGGGYFVRDRYLARSRGTEILCAWDDALASGIHTWVEHWSAERARHWPLGSDVALRLNPRRPGECEAESAWEQVTRARLRDMSVLAAAFLGTGVWLWRRQSRAPE
jgi:hypothetical protein